MSRKSTLTRSDRLLEPVRTVRRRKSAACTQNAPTRGKRMLFMKKDVIIEIRGVYRQEGDEDEIELFTTGSYYKRNGNYFIAYDESEATGFEGTRTLLKVESNDRVTLSRSGASKSQLIIERGVRHQCHYDTGYGAMTIGVSGDRIVSHLDDNGGRLEFSYSLDVNTLLASENAVYINVREQPQ